MKKLEKQVSTMMHDYIIGCHKYLFWILIL